MNPIELTLTLRPDYLRKAAKGERIDILARLASLPSVRHVAGNVNYSVTVSLDATEEGALRTAVEGICTVAMRTFVESFGVVSPVLGQRWGSER